MAGGCCRFDERPHNLSPQTCRPGCIVSSYCAVLMVYVGRDRARSFMFCLEQTWTIELMQSTRPSRTELGRCARSSCPFLPHVIQTLRNYPPKLALRECVASWDCTATGESQPRSASLRVPAGVCRDLRRRHFQHVPRANPHPSQVSWTHASPPAHLLLPWLHSHARCTAAPPPCAATLPHAPPPPPPLTAAPRRSVFPRHVCAFPPRL